MDQKIRPTHRIQKDVLNPEEYYRNEFSSDETQWPTDDQEDSDHSPKRIRLDQLNTTGHQFESPSSTPITSTIIDIHDRPVQPPSSLVRRGATSNTENEIEDPSRIRGFSSDIDISSEISGIGDSDQLDAAQEKDHLIAKLENEILELKQTLASVQESKDIELKAHAKKIELAALNIVNVGKRSK